MANSVDLDEETHLDPDEVAHYEPFHLDLHCSQISKLRVLGALRDNFLLVIQHHFTQKSAENFHNSKSNSIVCPNFHTYVQIFIELGTIDLLCWNPEKKR